MFSWLMIKGLILVSCGHKLRRSGQVTDKYETDKKSFEKYVSVKDMIYIKYLNYDAIHDETYDKIYATKNIFPLEYNLVLNEYPYDVEKDISHYVLWLTKDLTGKFEQIESILDEFLPNKEYIYYYNPIEHRSIPSVFHVQVFVKK